MREISTEPIKIGEHILVDGEKYVAEEAIGKMCSLCAFHNSYKCENIPCNGVIFKRVKKEPVEKMNKKAFKAGDCKHCPIKRECRECEIKDLTCEELYNAINEGKDV